MPADFDSRAQARVGTVINSKYQIERLLGSGGMATVYQGAHRNGNPVAIKMLHPHLSVDAELRARFLREGYVANKVGHRGAVRVLDDDTAEDGAVFLVMELLEGATLDGLWERSGKRLPVQQVCELAYQLLDVLTAAHAKGIVHRDLKPENLFVTSDGVLKVLDFGIARIREGGSQAVTRTGRMMGTPAFMPPEQALGRSRQIDGQTDLWAVGATMFTLASGHYVHEAETVEEMLIRAGSQPARSVSSVASDLSPVLAALIDKALAFEKADRWPDAPTMEAALAAAYATTFRTPMPGMRGPSRTPLDPASLAATVQASSAKSQAAASTTAGVSHVGAEDDSPAGVPRRGTKRVAWIALAAVVSVLGGGALLLTRNQERASQAEEAASGATDLRAASAPPPAVAQSASTTTDPGAGSLAPLAALSVAAAPSASAPAAPRHPPAVASSKATSGPASPARAPSPERPPKNPNCNPPYTLDANGEQHFKPECFVR
jgi:serine/threonine-protein kinase